MSPLLIALIILISAVEIYAVHLFLKRRRANAIIGVSNRLPDFDCLTENGQRVNSQSLRGQNVVLMFVRGSWCPFCNEQIKSMSSHYREITQMGARMIIITRKPLSTTRRVADMFGMDFEYWLDEDLKAAELLGLVDNDGTPEKVRSEFGKRTIRPTVLVTDKERVIRYSFRSPNVSTRPDPKKIVAALKKLR